MAVRTRAQLWSRSLMLLILTIAGMASNAAARASEPSKKADSSLAQVRYIIRGLGERPPTGAWVKARVHDKLPGGSGVRTRRRQRASLSFRDGTYLHMNQLTEAVLIDAHRTLVSEGEVNEVAVPGTSHRVETAAAVAAAIGTSFDVRVAGNTTIIAVVEGAVLVHNKRGSVRVKSGHETQVQPGKKPSPPAPVDPSSITAWTKGLPQPPPDMNVALDANGGSANASSESTGDNDENLWPASNVDDGNLSTGWESDTGDPNPSITLSLGHGTPYLVSRIVIDPAATGGQPATTDLKNFSVIFSLLPNGPEASAQSTFHGHCRMQNMLQTFDLPHPMEASSVRITADSNYGDADHVSIAEIEVVGTPLRRSPGTWSVLGNGLALDTPTGLAQDSAGNLYVGEAGSARQIDKLSQSGNVLAHVGSARSSAGGPIDPEGIAVDRDGNVYVADFFSNRVQKLAPDGRLLTEWSTSSPGEPLPTTPSGLALDADGNVFVADAANNWVQKFAPTGQLLAQWPVGGDSPHGVAVDQNGDVYVAIWSDNFIEKLSPDGKELEKIGSPGTGPGQLDGPWGVAVDPQGNIFVTEEYNDRVQEFSPDGKSLGAWGIGGSEVGQVDGPEGIVVDPSGTVYVTDTGNGRIQKLVPGK